MARVIYSNIVNEIKGSVGGLTFHRNVSGPTVRLRPSNRRTANDLENLIRSDFSFLALEWNSLTQAERDQWTAYALANDFYNRYNELKARSGYNVFMSVNSVRNYLGLFTIIIPDVYTMPAVADNLNLIIDNVQISLFFDSTSLDPNLYYIVFASPPNRYSYSKQRSQLRYIGNYQPNGAMSIDITVPYETVFNLSWPPAGLIVGLRITCAVCVVHAPSGTSSIYSFSTALY